MIGREEWCGFPDLGLPAVKARVDTGARTSALHAYDIKILKNYSGDVVTFKIHPLQRNSEIVCECRAPLLDRRVVVSSNGERETRCVIKTTIEFATISILAELTLTSRHNMSFRMLLGREALKKAKFIVDPSKSMLLGKRIGIATLYNGL